MYNFKLRGSFFILFSLTFSILVAMGVYRTASAQSAIRQKAPAPGETNYNPAKPWVFWYWMEATVSSPGIRADLIAMKEQGIAGAYLMCIKGKPDSLLIKPAVVQLTPLWWTKIREAFQIADSLGLKLAMHVGDGFATAGGPWITPELSMQKVIWSDTTLTGGRDLKLRLSRPKGIQENYYKDIAVYAFPALIGTGISTSTIRPVVTTNATGQDASILIDPDNTENFTSKKPCWIDYGFKEPFICRTIQVRTKGVTFQAKRLRLYISQDGEHYTFCKQLRPTRSGWQDYKYPVSYALPAVKAKHFKFVYDPEGTEPGSEDLDNAKWSPSLKLTGLLLSAEPQVPQFAGKSGIIWRIAKRADQDVLPDKLCIPTSSLINITSALDTAGVLHWKAPVGKWTIVRMGHSSTGQVNETAGGGRGLECDKFNPAAVKLQFDQWYGRIAAKMGPELSGEVLKIFHVDSWECGSQNWSPVFREAFEKRRGYDPVAYLPVMAGYPIGSAATSERFLYDIRLTIADLLNESFFGTLAGLAHRQGCLFSAECTAPVMVSDGLRHYDKVDIPMGEFWLRSPTHDKPNDIRDAVSGGHIYGKKIIQAEAFTELRNKWNEYPGMLKTLQDHHYAMGINRFVFHVMTENPWMNREPGMSLNGIGLYFQRNQTWWPLVHGWLGYTRRCQALLQRGVPVTDIAVFNGEEIPDRGILPDRLVADLPGIFGAKRVVSEKRRLANVGNPLQHIPEKVTSSAGITTAKDWVDPLHGYKYDALNADALLRLAKVKEGRIILPGGASYGLLVLPSLEKMDPNNACMSIPVAKKILALVRGGATVLVNRYPRLQPGLRGGAGADSLLVRIMDTLMGGRYSAENHPSGGVIKKLGKGRVLFGPYRKKDFLSIGLPKGFEALQKDGQKAKGLAWARRRLDDQSSLSMHGKKHVEWASDLPSLSGVSDLYFISNQLNRKRQLYIKIQVKQVGDIRDRQLKLYDAVTHSYVKRKQSKLSADKKTLSFWVTLPANGSLFVLFGDGPGQKENAFSKKPPSLQKEADPAVTLELKDYWEVQFDSARGGPVKPLTFKTLTDWKDHALRQIQDYSGMAVYQQDFKWNATKKGSDPAAIDMEKQIFLNLGEVKNIAGVTLNGVDCGVAWTFPYTVNISQALKAGNNHLEIRVANTWSNKLVADQKLPPDQRRTWTKAPFNLDGKARLSGGLLGPVTISEKSNVLHTLPIPIQKHVNK